MKNTTKLFLIHVTVLLILLFSSSSIAQSVESKHAVSANLVGVEYYGLFQNDFENGDFLTTGLKLGYHRNLGTDFLNLEIPLFFGGARVPIEPLPNNPLGDISSKTLKFSFGGLLQLQAFKKNRAIIPYFSGGFVASSIVDNGGLHAEIPLGIGIDFKIFKRSYFQIRPEYRIGLFQEDRNNLNINIGIKFLLNTDQDRIPSIEEDRDQDGVLNEVDKCPDIPGLSYLKGCPDSDSDGIIDQDDLCPTILGLAKFGGCPDTDNDGIPDPNDKCPKVAGPIPNGGCPKVDLDSDGDGVKDSMDECKDQPGLAKNKGCPDTDEDGIIDKNDDCPNEVGSPANNGCPVINKEVQEAISLSAKNVQFENNSSTIKTSSYGDLDNVVNLLNQYPDYNISINGHTDSQGSENYNKDLSERRAKACLEYLAKKGIRRARMTARGFGETRPLADNSTNEGKEKNRRVEFILFKN